MNTYSPATKWVLVVALVLLSPALPRAQVVYLEDPGFATVQARAKATGKKMLLVCCTEWCGPCKVIKNEHFKDVAVSELINAKYVAAYYDMEKGHGITMAKKYGVREYPTLIILDSEGNFIDRMEGTFTEIKDLLATLNALDEKPKNRYPGLSTSIDLPFPGFYNTFFESKKRSLFPRIQ